MNNQPQVEQYIDNLLLNNNIGHAYLLEVDDSYTSELAINFIKNIVKKDIFDDDKLENIFYQIDSGTFQDLKIIKPDGKQIKKEQIFNLIVEYKNKSINNFKRFYVIEYAEDLNVSAGNSILKFLEEPEEDIVAILVTKNIYKVLETIVSRCQILNFNNYSYCLKNNELISRSLNFLDIYERKSEKSVAYLSDLYLLKSEELKEIFQICSKVYEEVLLFKTNGKRGVFEQEVINRISEQNDKSELIKKINKLDLLINLFEFNVNNRVVLDNFIFGGEKNENNSN